MSTLFKQAMSLESQQSFSNVLSLEGAMAQYAQDQMDLSEDEVEYEKSQMEQNSLEEGFASLEKMYKKMESQIEEGESLDPVTLESARTLVTHLYGEDVLFNNASLESITGNDQMTLEGLRDLISKVGRSIRNNRDRMVQDFNWLQSRFFGGFKKASDFLDSAKKNVGKIDDSETPSSVTVSKRVLNNIHVSGSVKPSDISSALGLLSGYNTSLLSSLPKAIDDLGKLAEKHHRIIINDPALKDSPDKINLETFTKEADEVINRLLKGQESLVDKSLPGGKKITFQSRNMVRVDDGRAPSTATVYSKEELTSLITTAQEALEQVIALQKPYDAISEIMSEVHSNRFDGTTKEELKSVAIDMFKATGIMVLTYVAAFALVTAVFGPIALIGSGTVAASSTAAIIAGAESAWIGSTLASMVGGTGIGIVGLMSIFKESDATATQGRTVMRQLSNVITDNIRYQNHVIKSLNVMIKAQLDAYGVDGKEPETLDD